MSFIYFIECNNFIKIGYTNNTKLRMVDLQSASPYPLKLIKRIEGTKLMEQKFHNYFLDLKVRGEWFRKTDDLVDFINQLDGEKIMTKSQWENINKKNQFKSKDKDRIIRKLQRENDKLKVKIEAYNAYDNYISEQNQKKFTRPTYVDREIYNKFSNKCHQNFRAVADVLTELMQLYIEKGESMFKEQNI